MVFFTIVYIQKEQVDGLKNDHDMRKFYGHIDKVRTLGLIMCKKDTPNLYKIKAAKELDNVVKTVSLRKWCLLR
jgi:hypothetical protein